VKPIHLSGLNGIRAIAALAVVFNHVTWALPDFGLDRYVLGKLPAGLAKGMSLGNFGVSIFFGLSGFLITFLLLEEKKLGEINIRHFYLRRILRIWPLYYAYFALSVITLIAYNLPFETTFLVYYIFLLPNVLFILHGGVQLIGHYWSIGVEEQFYAFWPWIINKSKSILFVTITTCVSLVILKCAAHYYDLQWRNGEASWAYLIFHVTRFQCMLIGAIGAILYFDKNKTFLRLTDNYVSQAISWTAVFLAAVDRFHISSVLDNEIFSLVTVVIIVGQVRKSHRIVNLELLPFEYLGRISYGIYVIHPIVIFYLSRVIPVNDDAKFASYLLVYSSVFVATVVIAHFSYHFFERRFLLLKEKYSSIKNSDVTITANS
jgi:peptidoglycan/LPS O-acetylase OafA/YrhL